MQAHKIVLLWYGYFVTLVETKNEPAFPILDRSDI